MSRKGAARARTRSALREFDVETPRKHVSRYSVGLSVYTMDVCGRWTVS